MSSFRYQGDQDHSGPRNLLRRREHYNHRANDKRVEVLGQNYHGQEEYEAFAIQVWLLAMDLVLRDVPFEDSKRDCIKTESGQCLR